MKPRHPCWEPPLISLSDVPLCGLRVSSDRSMRPWPSWNWSTSSTAAWPERTAPTRPAAWNIWSTKATRDGTTCRSASPPSCADSRSILRLLCSLEARRTGSGRLYTVLGRSLSDFVRLGWQEIEVSSVNLYGKKLQGSGCSLRKWLSRRTLELTVPSQHVFVGFFTFILFFSHPAFHWPAGGVWDCTGQHPGVADRDGFAAH